MNSGQVALAAVIASVIGPLLLAALTNRNRRLERLEDYARQDEVARRAAEATELLAGNQRAAAARAAEVAEQAKRAAELLLRTNQDTRRDAREMNVRLEQIHKLVNSELTQAQQRELDATVAMLAAIREVVAMKIERGLDPSPETLATMDQIQARIEVLGRVIAHKLEVTANATREREQQEGLA